MEDEGYLIKQRKEKLKNFQEIGLNPYSYKFDKNAYAKNILEDNRKLKNGERTKKRVKIAGRIISSRLMGRSLFGDLQDSTGKIQFYIKENLVGKDRYKLFKKFDVGDIIGVEGLIFKTNKGETSVEAKKFDLLTKSLRPLPAKWHGLKDKEIRYRQRYLDLIMNPKIKDAFAIRILIIHHIREFLVKKGYVEVETPVLQPIYGGTNARPFKTFLNDLKIHTYLRISNELYLKRLIVGGYEKIFEFSKDFRNEGIDKTHNPEFILMETMWAYADYKDNMDLTEEMIEYVAKNIFGTTKLNYQGKIIDVKRPWKRLGMVQAIKKYVKIDITNMNDGEIKSFIDNHKIKLEGEFSRGMAIQLIFEEFVESKLIQPTIIYDFPHETCVLAKQKRDNPFYGERFEPFINGWEFGNSYSEENRPEILKREWEKEEKKLIRGDEEAQRMDKDFIEALEYGMPPTSGLGIGVDRLAILFSDQESIRDIIMFPFMKPV